jgi:hypothetical protein
MQQACTTLGLPEEAERCMIVREIADARRPDPTGYITKTRHLDGLYTRLARDPSDAAARAALDTAVPGLLASQRIIRAGSLALIGGVDYLRQPLVSEQVGETEGLVQQVYITGLLARLEQHRVELAYQAGHNRRAQTLEPT